MDSSIIPHFSIIKTPTPSVRDYLSVLSHPSSEPYGYGQTGVPDYESLLAYLAELAHTPDLAPDTRPQ